MASLAQAAAMRPPLWRDRHQAGVELAGILTHWHRHPEALVIGLPRGGVVVAAAVARALQLPLASWAVRKLAHPSEPELALGAIAPGGVLLWESPDRLPLRLDAPLRRRLIAEQQAELNRRQILYADPDLRALEQRPLLVVDDGVATGLTVRAALESLRQARPRELVLAVPIIEARVLERLQPLVDALEILVVTHDLQAVGQWYEQFESVSDQQVIDLLTAGRSIRT